MDELELSVVLTDLDIDSAAVTEEVRSAIEELILGADWSAQVSIIKVRRES